MTGAWKRKAIAWMVSLGLFVLMALPAQAAGSLPPAGQQQPGGSQQDGDPQQPGDSQQEGDPQESADPQLFDAGDAPTVADDVIFDETGANDFRISYAGPNTNTNYRGWYPAVAYNSTDQRYLVVWWGNDDAPGMVLNEYEIFAQQMNADTGAAIGNNFRISFMGINGNASYSAINPDVAYNATDNQYLVVWEGEATIDRYEIWGQRLDGATGAAIGSAFRISSMGVIGDVNYNGYGASVAWNSADNEYMVVWSGDSNTHGTLNEEFEIFGQRIEANTANLIGANFLISDMGPNNNAAYDASAPDVSYSSFANEYWVVWNADDNANGMIDEENEIFIQRLDASTGAATGLDDYRVSAMGPTGNPNWDALSPQLACSTQRNECLVTWSGDHNTNGQIDGEFEIFMQRISGASSSSMTLFGQYRVSNMNGLGDINYGGFEPDVTYNPMADEYLVAWWGKGMARVNLQTEVFVQRITGLGQQIGNDTAVSSMGPEGVDTLQATYATVVFNPYRFEYLIVWHGDNNIAPLINDELEVFGQRLTGGDLFEVMLPFVSRE